MVKRR